MQFLRDHHTALRVPVWVAIIDNIAKRARLGAEPRHELVHLLLERRRLRARAHARGDQPSQDGGGAPGVYLEYQTP